MNSIRHCCFIVLSFCYAFSISSGVNGSSIFSGVADICFSSDENRSSKKFCYFEYLIFLWCDKVKAVIINFEWLFWFFGVDFPHCLIMLAWTIFARFYLFEFFIQFSSFSNLSWFLNFLRTLFLSFLSCCLCCLFWLDSASSLSFFFCW